MTHPILDEIAAWDRNRPRSQQAELGASQLKGCRAAAVLRINGVPETDSRLRWDALVGTALHAVCEAAAPEGVLVEQRFEYRGVWATIDRFEPARKTLTDVKTKDDRAAIDKVRKYGPSEQHKAQLNIGAAALKAAGYEVDRIELLYLPRVGEPSDAYLWESVPDPALADEAAEWAAQVNATAQERVGLEPAGQVEGLRDEPESFCRVYCPFVTACLGPRVEVAVDDPLLTATAQEYLAADDEEKAAAARKAAARRFLSEFEQLPGLRWQGGNSSVVDEVDVDAVLAGYRALIGEPPTRRVEKVSARQLRRTA